MKTITVFFVLSVGFLLETSTAQVKGVTKGDHVRITASSVSDSIITGRVDSLTQTTIRVSKLSSEQLSTDIPIDAVEQLEIRREVGQTGRGALIGGGFGAFTIGFITMSSNESCDEDEWCLVEYSDGQAFLMGAAVGALSGAVLGAIIGSTSKVEEWEKIPVEITSAPLTLRIYDQPNRHAPGIRIKWSF